MFCTRCGKDIKEGNSFCEGCGAPAPRSEDVGKLVADPAPLAPVLAASSTVSMPASTVTGDAGEVVVVPPQDQSKTGVASFCTSCGAPFKGDTAFCTRCGRPVGDIPATSLPQTVAASTAGHPKQAGQPRQHRWEKPSKGLIVGLIAAGVVLLAAAGVVLFLLLEPGAAPNEQVVADVPVAAEVDARGESSTDGGNAVESAEPEADSIAPAAPESADAEAAASEMSAPESETAPVEEPAVSEYILPDSDIRAYTTSELGALSDWELFVARNEIFARHGRGFLNQELAQYFEGKSWYTQRYSPEEFDAMPSPLSAVEKQNTETMIALEQSRGSQYL